MKVIDTITVTKVANGWIIQPGPIGTNQFTHVAMTPKEVADHIEKWAQATRLPGIVEN